MVHVMLNPPKAGKKAAAKSEKKPSKRKYKRHGPRVCMPRVDLRYAKSLRRMKRKILRKLPRKKVICLPTAAIRAASSLKKLKHRYLGVKYGFGKTPWTKAAKAAASAVPSPTIHQVRITPSRPPKFSTPQERARWEAATGTPATGPYGMYASPAGRVRYGRPSPLKSARKLAAKVAKPKAAKKGKKKKITYEQWLSMLPLERKMAGITKSMIKASNPMIARNYPLPMYSLNDAAELSSLRDGLTAGYRPSALMSALPVVGGLVANSLLSALANKLVSQRVTLGEKWKNPVGLAVGLGTAGALAAITRMIAPKYAGKVFLGALTQVAWDGYQNYLAPKVKKTLGLEGMRGWDAGPDTFGLWCEECDKEEDIGDYYPRSVRPVMIPATIPSTVDQIVGTVVPPAAITVQAPPNVSAPTSPALVAKVNGKTVPVERVGPPRSRAPLAGSVDGMGDFLTPNQVASATSLGDTGDLSSYL